KSSPNRFPPYQSLLGVLTGRYTRPRSSSTLNGAHTLVWPVVRQASLSHVAAPGSVGFFGMGLNDHTRLPVFTSNACTSPGGSLGYTSLSATPLPTITRSRQTTGGDVCV